MDGINIGMSWENIRFNVKDVIQIACFIVTASFFFSAQNSKIESIIEVVKEMKADTKENNTETKVTSQTLINQVNANTVQIKLLEQRVAVLEAHSK